MAAQFVDALKGYEYFLENRGKATLEEVNEFLDKIDHKHIHQRTYDHYQKLMRRGFRSYLPINQFDVSRTLGKLQMAADRRRYNRQYIRLDAKISKEGEKWISAIIRDKSLVGFGMETIEPLKLKNGNPLLVHIDEYLDIPAILVWKHREGNIIRFGVRSLLFIETFRIIEKKILLVKLTGQLIVKKSPNKFVTWKEIYRILEKINELIESSSELIDEIARIIGDKDFQLSQPVISDISFDSPFNIKITIDVNVAKILNVILEWCFLGKARKDILSKKTKGFKKGIILENKEQLLELEYRRNAINPKKETSEPGVPKRLSDLLIKIFKIIFKRKQLPSKLLEPGSLEYGILKDQVLSASSELTAGDDPEIEIKAKENPSNETKGKKGS